MKYVCLKRKDEKLIKVLKIYDKSSVKANLNYSYNTSHKLSSPVTTLDIIYFNFA